MIILYLNQETYDYFLNLVLIVLQEDNMTNPNTLKLDHDSIQLSSSEYNYIGGCNNKVEAAKLLVKINREIETVKYQYDMLPS